jgi:heme-degrading monooxygenase HmoA
MFARFAEFALISDKTSLLDALRTKALPLLRQQPGFVELIPFFDEVGQDTGIVISLWDSNHHADRYEVEAYPHVFQAMKPYARVCSVARYHVEPSLSARNIRKQAAA